MNANEQNIDSLVNEKLSIILSSKIPITYNSVHDNLERRNLLFAQIVIQSELLYDVLTKDPQFALSADQKQKLVNFIQKAVDINPKEAQLFSNFIVKINTDSNKSLKDTLQENQSINNYLNIIDLLNYDKKRINPKFLDKFDSMIPPAIMARFNLKSESDNDKLNNDIKVMKNLWTLQNPKNIDLQTALNLYSQGTPSNLGLDNTRKLIYDTLVKKASIKDLKGVYDLDNVSIELKSLIIDDVKKRVNNIPDKEVFNLHKDFLRQSETDNKLLDVITDRYNKISIIKTTFYKLQEHGQKLFTKMLDIIILPNRNKDILTSNVRHHSNMQKNNLSGKVNITSNPDVRKTDKLSADLEKQIILGMQQNILNKNSDEISPTVRAPKSLLPKPNLVKKRSREK